MRYGARRNMGDDHGPVASTGTSAAGELTAAWIDLAIRIGVLALLLYASYLLVSPFITVAIWSVVLSVAIHPAYEWLVRTLGGRRRLAAAVLTALGLVIVIGPATCSTASRCCPTFSISGRSHCRRRPPP
jgi:hypothetical protein